MSEKKKFYIATAIAYASKQPHIGNDYDLVIADCIARFKKLCGYEVFFSTGTDEHGQKIEEIAKAVGITPKESATKVSDMIYDTYKRLNIGFDKFIRTSENYHEEAVKKIFVKLYNNGDIYKNYYEGLYCVPCESFYTPSQVKDSDGKCPDCGAELRESKEEAYSLKLSKYQDKLERFFEENLDFLTPEQRTREIMNNFIKPGLQDLCVSRSNIKWGVPVEFDSGHVIYVWIDALSNYITLLGYHPDNQEQPELFKKYWPCDLHVVGKDITRFHAIYWLVILMALELELPKKMLAHPWVLFNEAKMSKSKGNVVYSTDVIDKFGTDALRYYLLSEIPFDRDGSFTYSNFIKVYNSMLANTLGNLVSRTIAMTEKYFGGMIPEAGDCEAIDKDLQDYIIGEAGDYAALMNEYKTAEAIGKITNILYRANKYIDETEPWILAKDENNKARLGTVLYNLLESIRISAILLSPVIPETSEKIFTQIHTDVKDYESAFLFGGLKSGVKVGKSEILFARLDEAKIIEELEKEDELVGRDALSAQKNKQETPAKPENSEITIDDFMKTELKVAQILECEKVKKSDKLLKLQVDAGSEKRQIVSGIAQFYNPADLIGKKIILVSNLKPAKLRGIESQGMLLASNEMVDEKENVRVIFVNDEAAIGSRVR